MSLFSATGTGFFTAWQPASENGGIYVTDKEFEYYS